MSDEIRKIEYDLFVLNEQIRYLNIVKDILNATVGNNIAITRHLIDGNACQCFVICGASGSGKTRSIEMANRRLNADVSIDAFVECCDFCSCDDVEIIEQAMQKDGAHYRGHSYIAYSIMDKEMGELLAERNPNLSVVFINR